MRPLEQNGEHFIVLRLRLLMHAGLPFAILTMAEKVLSNMTRLDVESWLNLTARMLHIHRRDRASIDTPPPRKSMLASTLPVSRLFATASGQQPKHYQKTLEG